MTRNRPIEVALVHYEISPDWETARPPRPAPKPGKKEKAKRHNGLKVTPADKWFSLCIRERANWTCERCGTHYAPPTRALHCSHFEGRGNWAVRFEPLNGVCLCYGCHQIVGARPTLHSEFYTTIFGEPSKQIVNEKSNNIALYKELKRTNGKGEIADHYKKEFERMQEIRSKGVTGRIEFTGWI